MDVLREYVVEGDEFLDAIEITVAMERDDQDYPFVYIDQGDDTIRVHPAQIQNLIDALRIAGKEAHSL